MVKVVKKMTDDGLLTGLALGGLFIGVPLAVGAVWFSDRSYNAGLKGAELAYRGIIFGRTCDGVLVLLSRFDGGREVRLRLQNLEWKVYQLEQASSELKAGYMVTRSKIEKL